MALLSPRKATTASISSPSKTDRSVYGSPVRFVPPVSSQPAPSSNLQASSITTSTSKLFKGKAPVQAPLPAIVEAPNSPLKTVNGASAVVSKPIKQIPVPIKPSALPKPKAFKISKLPKPAGIPVPQHVRTTTVNMVHVPHVNISCSPTKAEAVPVLLPPALPVPAPPPRKKVFRQVIPGTLTGWEGKPAPTIVETQDVSLTQGSSNPSSDALPENNSSDEESSTVRRSSRRKVSETRTPSPEAATELSKAPVEEQSSPRRSRRISKEKENTAAVDQSAKVASRPAAVPKSRAAATPKPPPPGITGLQMSDKELKNLTLKNTARNQTYYVQIDLQVVHKDYPRPPSPSSRVRAAIGIEEKEAEAKKRGRTERAKKRGLLEEEMDREEDESPLKHFRAPGDEEDYETPKRRKLDGEGGFVVGGAETEQRFAALQLGPPEGSKNPRSRAGSSDPAAFNPPNFESTERFVKPNSKGRFVRWNKKLAFHCDADEQPTVPGANPGKGILARDAAAARLDKVGNVPEAGQLPPEIRKDVVVVFKYVYADDLAVNSEDANMEEDEYVPSPPKKGKRKRAAA